MKKFYFETKHDEICYTESYFIDKMKDRGIQEIEVIKASPIKINGVFWCKHEGFMGDGSDQYCGNQCNAYTPRNGKSGCCKYYTTVLYEQGEKTILKLK